MRGSGRPGQRVCHSSLSPPHERAACSPATTTTATTATTATMWPKAPHAQAMPCSSSAALRKTIRLDVRSTTPPSEPSRALQLSSRAMGTCTGAGQCVCDVQSTASHHVPLPLPTVARLIGSQSREENPRNVALCRIASHACTSARLRTTHCTACEPPTVVSGDATLLICVATVLSISCFCSRIRIFGSQTSVTRHGHG